MSDVSKVFPSGAVALQDVNVHIEPGEFVFVVGPSGAVNLLLLKCYSVKCCLQPAIFLLMV